MFKIPKYKKKLESERVINTGTIGEWFANLMLGGKMVRKGTHDIKFGKERVEVKSSKLQYHKQWCTPAWQFCLSKKQKRYSSKVLFILLSEDSQFLTSFLVPRTEVKAGKVWLGPRTYSNFLPYKYFSV